MTAEPPVAPAAAPNIAAAPKAPASAAPASAPAPPAGEAPVAKAGSARDAFFTRIEAKAKVEGAPVAAPADKKPDAKPADAKAPDAPAAEPAEEVIEEQVAAEKAAAADPKKKVNPWKLYKEEKAARAKLEQEHAETRKLAGDPEARKAELENFQKVQARAKELEDHIRFVDYSKSSEFQEKYQKPYEQEWARSMSELQEVSVVDPATGAERAFSANDMLKLVNLPLKEARIAAQEMVGESADDVMDFRKEIRRLNDAQTSALEKARKEGGERLKAIQEEGQNKQRQVSEMVAKSWEEANKKLLDDPKVGQFLKPAEGDADGKARLDRGYKFVDSAFSQNPMDPKLSPEERAKVVERQAAARHRAAGFGYARHLAETRAARITELEAKIAEYEKSTPEMGAGAPAAGGAAPKVSAMDRLNAAIEAKARPGL